MASSRHGPGPAPSRLSPVTHTGHAFATTIIENILWQEEHVITTISTVLRAFRTPNNKVMRTPETKLAQPRARADLVRLDVGGKLGHVAASVMAGRLGGNGP